MTASKQLLAWLSDDGILAVDVSCIHRRQDNSRCVSITVWKNLQAPANNGHYWRCFWYDEKQGWLRPEESKRVPIELDGEHAADSKRLCKRLTDIATTATADCRGLLHFGGKDL